MKIISVSIRNFRGICEGHIMLNGHSVFIGDNNAGKSTILEAIDLVLGPDRASRVPVVDEHDFYKGVYYLENSEAPKIDIEVIVSNLTSSQKRRFKDNLEFWDITAKKLLDAGEIDKVDSNFVEEVLRVKFVGLYDGEEDDFKGETFFCSPQNPETLAYPRFSKIDKRECGFLYLRAIRTGSRALSMERGSLLDIILKIKEIRPKMWEEVLGQLKNTTVASDPKIGMKEIFVGIQDSLTEFVPKDWGSEPHLKVSDLTREHLRKTLTIFLSTGAEGYYAPLHHQGTGTVNTIVLALLSMIANERESVMFAMEEPEISIPPYTQKRIIENIRNKSNQAIFTSHSPFVLEEFSPEQIVLIQRSNDGKLLSKPVEFPKMIKAKNYNLEFRLRFSEALLAKRVLLTEGATEANAYSAAARKLNEIAPSNYSSLEALGIAIFDVKAQGSVSIFGNYFKDLGKIVMAIFDKQTETELKKITDNVHHSFESSYIGFEDLIMTEIDNDILMRFYEEIQSQNEWPSHLNRFIPQDTESIDEVKKAINEYFIWSKGGLTVSELIGMCTEEQQIPKTIRDVLKSIKEKLTEK